MGPGHVCGHTIIVYFQRNERKPWHHQPLWQWKNPFPALVERGQADEDLAFVCLASQRRNGGLGPLLNLSGRSSLVVQKEVCVCESTVYSGPSCNLQIETNNSGDICNYGKRLFTEPEKTD